MIGAEPSSQALEEVENPAGLKAPGHVVSTNQQDIGAALRSAAPWKAAMSTRRKVLERAAAAFEEAHAEIFALLAREAGKTLRDAVAELREAVDFLRYYAANAPHMPPIGVVTCISPWNFPLAIFTGQIAAALSCGNAVLAKPAEQTPLIASLAVSLMHKAGVPLHALQLCPGDGRVGAALTSDARVGGVAFTGSTATALKIRKSMATHMAPGAPFIAETGGLNAMIVDSTALPEQAVAAIIESAFQSAGQRCSALRCLYVQDDIADDFTTMLTGAMDMLTVADPWHIETDCGPVIDIDARDHIKAHVDQARSEGRILHELSAPKEGYFIAPTLIEVKGIFDLQEEIFGPVLHIARFKAGDLDTVVHDINATGFGLTFGLQTRIDDRVQSISDKIQAGNIYVNRNQIGAIVGSQPFGGEGLSGTGPKAGGPHYQARFCQNTVSEAVDDWEAADDLERLQRDLHASNEGERFDISMPGPTGESNQLGLRPRDPILCLGPGSSSAQAQYDSVLALGGRAVMADGHVAASDLNTLEGFSALLYWGAKDAGQTYAQALAERDGPILPVIMGLPDQAHTHHERHVCVDTTASGGNAALLGAQP